MERTCHRSIRENNSVSLRGGAADDGSINVSIRWPLA
jgi:hypothetical protein